MKCFCLLPLVQTAGVSVGQRNGLRPVLDGHRMSRRSSAGDLVPKDITEILALQPGKKKRGSSLSRAFSWLKGSKRKRSLSSGQSRTGDPSGRIGGSTTTKQIQAGGEHCKGKHKGFSLVAECRLLVGMGISLE